jgi:hypothetical protein
MALKALAESAKCFKKQQEDGKIVIQVNDTSFQHSYTQKNLEKIVIPQPSSLFTDGTNNIQVSFKETKNAFPWSFNASWTSLLPPNSNNCTVDLRTTCATTHTKVGETVRMDIVVNNKTDETQPMTLVKIGIPSAMSVQPWQLKELQEKRMFDYYEIFDNYLVFYFVTLKPKAPIAISLDLKAEIPGIYRAAASMAYLYYTNEYRTYAEGMYIEIGK